VYGSVRFVNQEKNNKKFAFGTSRVWLLGTIIVSKGLLYQVLCLNDPNEFCEIRPAASTTPRLRKAVLKLGERKADACIYIYATKTRS
jgi:hypothetical protein